MNKQFYQRFIIPKDLNLIFFQMPKVIDKYVLEQKIGNGQFGEVYKGKHQETLQDVAIKSIRRDQIKGKFYQLLESEIKVLRTCDNPYIIKLYALKKTPHNYYLMLEYCNGGDMLAKVRKEGILPEEEVIKYLCQILNAFQTLVRHKIMHRDFKLANILLHDGNIKIADFGFAKLLSEEDYTTTMLGSPLNMAPEVLGNSKYNSKADIWSIGACIFQMIYGKPPYQASNMADLAKLIRSKPLVFPSEIKVCEELKDVIKRMLTVDVKKRIQWHDLFNHPITNYFSKKRKAQVELELAEDESLMINTSKCYLKNNLILSNINELKQKSQINDYLVDIIRHGKKAADEKKQIKQNQSISKITKSTKFSINNSKRIVHFRNVYVFLATIADQILQTEEQHYQIATYVLVRKILNMIEWTLKMISGDECSLKGIQNWKQFKKTEDYARIQDYLIKEFDVFDAYNKSIEPIIKKKALQGAYDPDIKQLISSNTIKEAVYIKYLKQFLFTLTNSIVTRALSQRKLTENLQYWKLVYFGFKIIDVEQTFGVGDKEFDFQGFYHQFQKIEEQKMLLELQSLIQSCK